jgi:hypothetical protein
MTNNAVLNRIYSNNCTANNKQSLSLYDVSPTFFDLYVAKFREVSNKGIK